MEVHQGECVRRPGAPVWREVHRWKQTGEFAHERLRRIKVTIHKDKISRWEMGVVG
jgi:hypothetical protein